LTGPSARAAGAIPADGALVDGYGVGQDAYVAAVCNRRFAGRCAGTSGGCGVQPTFRRVLRANMTTGGRA